MGCRILFALLLGLLLPGELLASSIAYTKVQHAGTVAHTVTVNLADKDVRVTVALAEGGAGYSESFKSIIGRTKPVAAITGTFFDTKTLLPTGDIALFGNVVYEGCIGSALCVDSENRASVVSLREGRKTDWHGYETVLCAGPTLVADNKVAIALKHEGFRPAILAPARRTAVGITQAGKLILVTINRNASLYQLAKVMVAMGVEDGLCLDGGTSTGLYFADRYYAVPGRKLTNCLVVYSNESNYLAAKTELAPAELFAKTESKPESRPDVAIRQPNLRPQPTIAAATSLFKFSAFDRSPRIYARHRWLPY